MQNRVLRPSYGGYEDVPQDHIDKYGLLLQRKGIPCVPKVEFGHPIYKRIPVLQLQHQHMGDRFRKVLGLLS